jgi:hypothetical protein
MIVLGFIKWLLFIGIFLAGAIYFASVYTGTHFKDWFSPIRWKSVLIFLLKWTLKKLGDTPTYLEEHEIKQYMLRILACQPCVKNGNCLKCGCSTIPKMNTQSDECSIGRWGPFVSKEEWDEYEKVAGIEFKLTFNGKQIDEIVPPEERLIGVEPVTCQKEEINVTHKYTIMYDPNTDESEVYAGDLTVEDIQAMNEEAPVEEVTEEPNPIEMVTFDQTTISLGKIPKEKQLIEFSFTGDASVIEAVKPACGCTAEVIIDSVNNKITAIYDPQNDKGKAFSKTMTVFYNDGAPMHVKIQGKNKKNPKKSKTILTFTGEFL